MKHVKENDLAHGEFGDWAESIGIGRYQVSRFIRVADELGGSKLRTSANIGLDALYLIATMPEESRTESHTIPSTGEEKTLQRAPSIADCEQSKNIAPAKAVAIKL